MRLIEDATAITTVENSSSSRKKRKKRNHVISSKYICTINSQIYDAGKKAIIILTLLR